MLFSSSEFLFLFLPCVLFIYYVILPKNRNLQNIFLTFVSLCFYAWGEPYFVLIMIASILFNWWFAILIDKVRENKVKSKNIIVAMLCVNLGIMFIFKYLMFTLENINSLFNMNIGIPSIALPIGLSFFTFQAISYVIDVYRGKGEVQRNPLNVALYIAFFPQLIAGPIVRYQTISDQIKNRKENFSDFSYGCTRFIIGLGKKIVLSNNMALIADVAFEQSELTVLMAWIGAIAYTLQIFFDFSGYSDMAIGLGKMFGFHFQENFDYPYISKSISEFWKRWHISLGTWFRDYVYFPLGGSRVDTKLKLVFNLFVVWFLTGIWHGSNWTFLVWGGMYFVLIVLEKITGFEKRIGFLGHIYTMFFVVLGWVIFRSDSIVQSFDYILAMFGVGVTGVINDTALFNLTDYLGYWILSILFSFPVTKYVGEKFNYKKATFIYPILIIALFLISISFIIKGSYDPFIYFNF